MISQNERRIRLIKKRYRGSGLDAKETVELTRLNSEVAEHINQISPRSLEAIEQFEEFIKEVQAEYDRAQEAERRAGQVP
jgi:hypothetical protein